MMEELGVLEYLTLIQLPRNTFDGNLGTYTEGTNGGGMTFWFKTSTINLQTNRVAALFSEWCWKYCTSSVGWFTFGVTNIMP